MENIKDLEIDRKRYVEMLVEIINQFVKKRIELSPYDKTHITKYC